MGTANIRVKIGNRRPSPVASMARGVRKGDPGSLSNGSDGLGRTRVEVTDAASGVSGAGLDLSQSVRAAGNVSGTSFMVPNQHTGTPQASG